MIEKINSQVNIQSMLQTLRAFQAQAAGGMDDAGGKVGGAGSAQGAPGFTEMIRSSLSQVNDVQQHAKATAESYERGENVPLTDVVLSMQKSSIAFEATLQVRNKVLKAYEDILNMPV
ncbi:MAG: flagellar hook-basal body complex protein FliE [Betaproteobacteria bacterium]|jgi:flagellar hook-basal body complex protein FliE|nr:flagellar hook-basal body complex protein FliE [Rhodoferax sp.]MCX7266883.1 flagellar hook-basal body complex protein FliE [Burkholderiales bacterium]NBX14716.1 flagellar hook-basal body complex protein FliE [Betaproteobacteria bacterium]NBX90028.1 flagellar hook-basal body complex protein FliE [Betaproteobacteria bacterium]